MKHDYKEGPYSTGTLIERLEEMCGCGEEWGILAGRDVWPDDVLESIERIKRLEAALRQYACNCAFPCDEHLTDLECGLNARTALEGKDGP